jgi:hypothetical protein
VSSEQRSRRGEPVDWSRGIFLFVGIPVALCVVYAGLKYPVPWLWRHAGIFSILLIPLWIVVIGALTFLLGVAVPIVVAGATAIILWVMKGLLALAIDVILFLPTVATNSPRLYPRISPHLARGLLGCSSRVRRARVLKKLRPEEVSHIFVDRGGLSLLSRLSASERSVVLEGCGHKEIRSLLQMVGVENYPEFAWLLQKISPDKLQGHLYYETFTKRGQEIQVLKRLGIEIDAGTDKKPYRTLEA